MNNLQLISKYFYPNRILDIGCHVGEFYSACKAIYPSSYYFLIEGNKMCEQYLKNIKIDYSIQLLSDSIKEIEFFLNNKDLLSTGSSYYKECTIDNHFCDDNLIVEKRTTNTLDNLFKSDIVFDLIKIDTQGSELDIIRGGQRLLNSTKGLLLECSLDVCNKNAPLYEEVKSHLHTIGFEQREILDNHYYKGNLVQIDVLFTK